MKLVIEIEDNIKIGINAKPLVAGRIVQQDDPIIALDDIDLSIAEQTARLIEVANHIYKLVIGYYSKDRMQMLYISKRDTDKNSNIAIGDRLYLRRDI